MAKIYSGSGRSGGSSYLDAHGSENDFAQKKEPDLDREYVNEYANEHGRVTGQWVGSLAAEWGLDGKTIEQGDEVAKNLENGLMPDGSDKLTQRSNTSRKTTEEDALKALRMTAKYRDGEKPTPEAVKEWLQKHPKTSNRVAWFDFQVAPPKSVSIAALVDGDKRLLALHEVASTRAFAELEKFAARRVGHDENVSTGKLLAAKYTHTFSRSLDAQLHSHFITANVTIDDLAKRWGLETDQMCKAVEMASLNYQNEMALGCQKLGYDITTGADVKTFELSYISKERQLLHSSASKALEEQVRQFRAKHGREPGDAERRALNLLVRPEKALTSEKEVIEAMRSKDAPEAREAALAAIKHAKTKSLDTPERPLNLALAIEVVTFARDHIFERESVVPIHKIEAAALRQGLGKVDLESIRSAISHDKELFQLTDGRSSAAMMTTRKNLRMESEAVENCIARKGSSLPFSDSKPTSDLSAWTRANKGFKLKQEQQNAVKYVLETRDGIFSIRGVAGAGKTTMLQELDSQLSERGTSLLHLAPSAVAVEGLRKEGFEKAMTVAKYLIEVEKNPAAYRGRMIFVDEAGLSSIADGHKVQMLANRLNQRLCLVGDTRQHSSVAAGDFMRILEDHANLSAAVLSEITRQRPPQYLSAVMDFSKGKYAQGWAKLEEWGAIKEGGAEYLQNAAGDFLAKADQGKNIDAVLAVAPTHAELDQLNADIRLGLKKSSYLKGEEVQVDSFRSANLTAAQKREPASYKPGDVVMFQGSGEYRTIKEIDVEKKSIIFEEGSKMKLKRAAVTRFAVGSIGQIGMQAGDKVLIRANEKESGLVNGKILTVSGFGKDGSIFTKEGQTIPKGFADLKHGYAVTSHASQGKTVDHVVVAASSMRSEALYVSTSRGRNTLSVHVADKERMGSALSESQRTAAFDVRLAQAVAYKETRLRETRLQDVQEWSPGEIERLAKEKELNPTLEEATKLLENLEEEQEVAEEQSLDDELKKEKNITTSPVRD